MRHYLTTESIQNSLRVIGPAAIEPTDFTARVDLAELPAGQKIFYRVTFQSLDDAKVFSKPAPGSFLTAPNTKRDVSFVWGGDVRSEEHTSELQSLRHLVCRLLLEKKKT